MESPTTATPTATHFPYGLSAGEELGSANAADAHILELQAVMQSQTTAEDSGSVLAIINFDPKLDQGRACTGQRWQSLQMRLSLDKILFHNSNKINSMLEPAKQQRIRRRLGFTTLPPGVDYVLDFTPPNEGAELADLTAALWLPQVVKIWFLAGQYIPLASLNTDPRGFQGRALGDNAAGATLTLGHDDDCKNESCLDNLSLWQVSPTVPGIVEEDALSPVPKHIPDWRRVKDYCNIRHRAAIMRILRAINGEGLLINSATRMWTLAQTALYLEVPLAVIDPITSWFVAAPNTKFIEICPEKTFQLAYSLKIADLLVASFRILVSELAVDFAATMPTPRRPPTTWIGRKRDDYGDFPSDPVEYAARAFSERMSGLMADVLADNPLDALTKAATTNTDGIKWYLTEWEKLRSFGQYIMSGPDSPLRKAYTMLLNALPEVAKQKFRAALSSTVSGNLFSLIEAQRTHYIPISQRARTHVSTLYDNLNDIQKGLTAIFWHNLRSTACMGGSTNQTTIWSEATYMNKRLWRLVKNFNDELKIAKDKKVMPHYVLADFKLASFTLDFVCSVNDLCEKVLDRAPIGNKSNDIPLFLSDHLLLSLGDKEINFLPIWAYGLDDGTGGVFQEVIPPADMGPSEPGPAYHTGHTVGTNASTTDMGDCTSTVAPSDLGFENLEIYSAVGSTVHGSMDAQQSITTGPARGRVVAVSESIESESFSKADEEYANAMFAMPSEHQDMGAALAMYVEDPDEVGTTTTESDFDGIAFSVVESVTGAELLNAGSSIPGPATVGTEGAVKSTPPKPTTTTLLDDFGLDNFDEDMYDFDDDTSTVDGST